MLFALFAAVVLIPLALFLLKDYIPTPTPPSLGDRAFGNLTIPGSTQETPDTSSATEKVSGLGSGGAAEPTQEDSLSATYPVIDELSYNQDVVAYDYVYSGALPDLNAIDTRVFRRVNALELPESINKAFSQLKLGILPLSAFKNLYLSSFTVTQDDQNGFVVSVDPMNNVLSISRNNGYWETLDYSRVLKENDLPSDESLIKLANDFLTTFQIDRSAFGEPSIDRSWIDPMVWVPDSLAVQYPLIVDGREVYGLWGQPSGMSITVNVRSGLVDSFFAPGPSTLETSDYEIVTDAQAILDVVKRGGLWEYQPEDAKKVYISTLGEPDLILAEHFLYAEMNGTGKTLYVPALRFPIVSRDEEAPYKKDWVVVPLVKEILQGTEPVVETLEIK